MWTLATSKSTAEMGVRRYWGIIYHMFPAAKQFNNEAYTSANSPY